MKYTRRDITKATARLVAAPAALVTVARAQQTASQNANSTSPRGPFKKVVDINFVGKNMCRVENTLPGIDAQFTAYNAGGQAVPNQRQGSKKNRSQPVIKIINSVKIASAELDILYIQAGDVQSAHVFEPPIPHFPGTSYIAIPFGSQGVELPIREHLGIGKDDKDVAVVELKVGRLPEPFRPCEHSHALSLREHTEIIIEC